MAVTATATTVLAAGFNQASVTSTITTIFTSMGFATFDTATGATNLLVYRFIVNPAAAKSTVFLVFSISNAANPVVTALTSDNWNTGTKTATGQVTSQTVTLTSTAQVQFKGFTSTEMTLLLMIGGTATVANTLGYIRPASKPTWWDEATSLYAFLFAMPNTYAGGESGPQVGGPPWIGISFPNPFSTTVTRLFALNAAAKFAVLPSPAQNTVLPKVFFASAVSDIAGISSSDLTSVALPNGFAAGDQIVVSAGVEEYVLLNPVVQSNAGLYYSGFSLRVV